MNTDRLVEVLSVNPEPVQPGHFARTLILAMVTGEAAAFGLMFVTVGPRPEVCSKAHFDWLAVKLLFSLSMIGAGAPLLVRSMVPGRENETNWTLIFFPFLAAISVALGLFLRDPIHRWRGMLLGANRWSSVHCLLYIMLFAAVPLAALILALRKGAPTQLIRAGAIAGIVAGGLGAAAYAFSCRSDTIQFIGIWYGAATALCAAIGARVGPRLLRW